MLKAYTRLSVAVIFILLIGISHVAAEAPAEKEKVFSLLKGAQEAQFSLGEKHRDMTEVQSVLDPYFSREYQEQFLDAHIFKEEKGYITYGTDVPHFYIPFFTYDENTKIKQDEASGKIYVYEFFGVDESEGYLYPDHYEFVELEQNEQGLQVVSYGYDEEQPGFLKEVSDARTMESPKNEKKTAAINVVNDQQKENEKTFSLYQLTKPFASFVFMPGTQNPTLAFYQFLPMFASHYFIHEAELKMLVTR
ncbi:DUF3993 domain-containing protein [Bacillus tianshenii]|uniref:DUF3993 domain-containing protein n=1 Tax=Sutcliffiella tianshenii TaxID=1463404 RepID=UPI001CD4D0CB|nr:DUF3993 domain-containing protein [Bacillus tianshenii]MCA1319048.1 DUF3993 domain-containing protein [Bacillus tianshenii]